MSFIDSYKRLEKLCSEIYGNGVKSYIEEMDNNPMGSRYVTGWDADLKRLKYYKWVRNQISHEPDCTEDNMCEHGDAEWLDYFRSRIMSGSDPLTLYRKARYPHATQKSMQTQKVEYTYPRYTQRSAPKTTGCLTYVIGALLVISVVVLILAII